MIAQNNNKYAKQLEALLDFKTSTLKDTINFSSALKEINKDLDKRIKKAQKLSQDPDSIMTKIVALLKNMKSLVNDDFF